MSRLPCKVKVYNLYYATLFMVLIGCKNYELKNLADPPLDCYPDFVMHVSSIYFDPFLQLSPDQLHGDSLKIIHQSGFVCIKRINNEYASHKFFIRDCGPISENTYRFVLMPHKESVFDTDILFVLSYVLEIKEENGNVDLLLQSYINESYAEKASGRIKYLAKQTKSLRRRVKDCAFDPNRTSS